MYCSSVFYVSLHPHSFFRTIGEPKASVTCYLTTLNCELLTIASTNCLHELCSQNKAVEEGIYSCPGPHCATQYPISFWGATVSSTLHPFAVGGVESSLSSRSELLTHPGHSKHRISWFRYEQVIHLEPVMHSSWDCWGRHRLTAGYSRQNG